MTNFRIILDIESRNHLQKDCQGDTRRLMMGIAGIKFLDQEKFLFFDISDIEKLRLVLFEAKEIIGFNLVGHNGLDYKMLENCGILTDDLVPKTFDIMTCLIRSFGSYKDFSLDNIVEHTFKIRKKVGKTPNYRLIQNNQIDQVKTNLIHELTLIEKLYHRVIKGGLISFKTPSGLVNQHELPQFAGYHPQFNEEISEPYDLPFVGMRLQIKDKTDKMITCSQCKKKWRIKSICYYGDTDHEEIRCPECGCFLIEVRCSLLGPETTIEPEDL